MMNRYTGNNSSSSKTTISNSGDISASSDGQSILSSATSFFSKRVQSTPDNNRIGSLPDTTNNANSSSTPLSLLSSASSFIFNRFSSSSNESSAILNSQAPQKFTSSLSSNQLSEKNNDIPSNGGKISLVSLIIFNWTDRDGEDKCILLSANYNLSFFNFFVRSKIKPLITFNARLIASRTKLGQRVQVSLEQNLGYVYAYVHPSGLAITCVTSLNYPTKIATSLLNETFKKFIEKYGLNDWKYFQSDLDVTNFLFQEEGEALLKLYQNPLEADKLFKVQKDLDEVKNIMLKNMDDLLKRGEKLDDLLEKSSHLTNDSIQFYRQAKKQNQCCQLF